MLKRTIGMRVKLKLNPGDKGAKKLSAEYGDRLVCVRYRYDKAAAKRYKTVELVVEEIPWTPPPIPGDPVFLKIAWNEKNEQELIKQAGGKWDRDRKLWQLAYNKAKELGLKARIQKDVPDK